MKKKITTFFWRRKYILLFLFLFITILTQRFLNQNQNGLVNSVASDGSGYYAYLPAAIIYQDFSYKYYTETENNIKGFYNPYFRLYKDKYPLNKYYCGTAICLLPFFLTGVVISAIAGTDINGYTDTFLMLISIASIFYFLLATFLITRISRFFQVSEKIGLWLALIFFFSTNLFHYVIQEPSMSHSYSFFAVTLFFYFLTKVIENVTTKNIIYLSLSLSLVALIRPPNVIVILFIPFFFPSIKDCGLFLKALFTKQLLKTSLAILIFGLAIFLQLTFYYLQTGDFIVESYPGETFNFSKPEIFNILLSYKKGLFLYTPFTLAALLFISIGLIDWYKRIVFLITFSIFTYITASWWCWYYGGGFSGRPFIDIYPLFIITLIVLYSKLNLTWRKVLAFVSIPFVFVNQVMAYQYTNRIMSDVDMDKERYWTVFLQLDLSKINNKRKESLIAERKQTSVALENFENFEPKDFIVNEGYESNFSYLFGKNDGFSKSFMLRPNDIKVDISKPFYVITECDVKPDDKSEKINLVVSIYEESNCIKWDFVFDSQFKTQSNGWKKMIHVVKINDYELNENRVIKIFTMKNKGKNLVDNLKYIILQ